MEKEEREAQEAKAREEAAARRNAAREATAAQKAQAARGEADRIADAKAAMEARYVLYVFVCMMSVNMRMCQDALGVRGFPTLFFPALVGGSDTGGMHRLLAHFDLSGSAFSA